MWLLFTLQNAGNTWPGTQQVLVGSWQQIPGLPTQRAVQQPLLTDTLASQALQDSWRQTLVLDNLEQSSLASLVRNHNFVISLSLHHLIIKYDLTVSHTFSLSHKFIWFDSSLFSLFFSSLSHSYFHNYALLHKLLQKSQQNTKFIIIGILIPEVEYWSCPNKLLHTQSCFK